MTHAFAYDALSDQVRLKRLVGVLDDLVYARAGVVRMLLEQPRQSELPDFHHFIARAASTESFSGRANFVHAGGASRSRGLALAKALGEAVERYCASIYDETDWPLASARDLGSSAARPEDFALYDEDQLGAAGFPFVRFDEDTKLRWRPTRDLLTREVIQVPAAMVHLPYYFYEGEGEAPICQPISTGLACHASLDEAALAALCEVLERDAFSITWQARLRHCRVSLQSLPPMLRDLVRRFEAVGCGVFLIWLRSDHGVPTILAGQRHDAPAMPAISFGAATAADPAEACLKALEELAHTLRWMYVLKRVLPPISMSEGYDQIISQETHLRFYGEIAHRGLAQFIDASEIEIPLSDIPGVDHGTPAETLVRIVGRLSARGYRTLAAELTTPDVAQLGLHVVRIIVPGMHPLAMGHRCRARGGHRLRIVPALLGHPGFDPIRDENPAPHPFA